VLKGAVTLISALPPLFANVQSSQDNQFILTSSFTLKGFFFAFFLFGLDTQLDVLQLEMDAP
jgi:hypothetical protein